MARLVINPGSSAAREIQLKPGTNLLGRGLANDFRIDDASVSTSHCRIVVENGKTIITDLGSTNGTYVGHALVQEAALRPGEPIHLGNVEMVFESDEAGSESVLETEPWPLATPSSVKMPAPPVVPVPPLPVPAPAAASSQNCKFHPKTIGRFFCRQCQLFFCELCVTTRSAGGVSHKFCRRCGAECAPVQVKLHRPAKDGFFACLPAAFVYPLRGAGALVIIAGIVVLTGLKFGRGMMLLGSARMLIFGLILQIFAGGYLFTYLQSIIHSTAAEDREMPELAGMSNFVDDILMPFCRLLGLVLFCFGPAIGLVIWVAVSDQTGVGVAIIPATVLGALYFPMAFLAVAILDSVAAANPLVILPSILKVPLEYLVTVLLLAAVFGFRALGDFLVTAVFPRGFSTPSMGEFFAMIGAQAFWSFMSFYLLIVAVHILGLLYVTKKEKLGWLAR